MKKNAGSMLKPIFPFGIFCNAYQSFQFENGPSGLCQSQQPLRALYKFCKASKHAIFALWEGWIGIDCSRR